MKETGTIAAVRVVVPVEEKEVSMPVLEVLENNFRALWCSIFFAVLSVSRRNVTVETFSCPPFPSSFVYDTIFDHSVKVLLFTLIILVLLILRPY